MAEKIYTRPVWLSNKKNLKRVCEFIQQKEPIHNSAALSLGAAVSASSLLENTKTVADELITDYTNQLHTLKMQFNNHQYQNIKSAHKITNPYEKIGTLFFQNRAAVKLLNIDADCGFIFNRNHFTLTDNEIFYFADLCGGRK